MDLFWVGGRRLFRGVLNFVAGFFDVFADALGRIAARADGRPEGAEENQGEEFVFHGVNWWLAR
jgi:hypothetical protein